ncbi:MAG: sirohydrochlorin chelatase, partial [Candidatus Acidiferrales bacterium]
AWVMPGWSQDALLVVAHGARQAEWNNRVLRIVEQVEWKGPVGVAFLMSAPEGHGFEEVVRKLDGSGVTRIVVLPLMVSSYGEHYEEIRYYVGDRQEKPEHAHHAPFETRAQLILTPAMDEHAVISKILTEQARAMSQSAKQESVVLVAHGPNDEEFNRQWLAKLGQHAERLQRGVGFRRVEVVTLRDDAPKPIRDAATEQLRAVVRKAGEDSRVLILPVLVSVGHIQRQIRERLAGLKYAMSDTGIADHRLAAEWIRRQAQAVLTGTAAADKR